MFGKTAAQLLTRFSQQLGHQFSHQINQINQRTSTVANGLMRLGTSASTDLNERNKFLKEKYEFKDSINKVDFEAHFPSLVKELTSLRPELKHIANWYKNVLNYNAVSGKKIRPLTFLNAYQIIMNHYGRTVDRELIYSLAWAIELYQVFFLVADDIMDHSITRRGSLCWHKKEEVGLIAINDCFFLEQSVYQILRKCRGHKCYSEIVDLFLETTQKTVYGQSFDLLVAPVGKKVDISKFDIDRYLTIAKYKTSYYSCSLPIRLAFYMHEINDPQLHQKIEELMSKVGILLQIQDDYFDAFSDPKVVGKIGTDIQDGKCCWPIVMCMKLSTNDQKEILSANYGVDDEECVQKVKEIYRELGIEALYKEHEEQLYNELMSLIHQICAETKLPDSIFKFQVDYLYKRNC